MKCILYLFFASAFLLACQGQDQDSPYFASRVQALSDEEKLALLPNELFVAVANKEEESVLKSILDENGLYLQDTNDQGDTALGVAIQFYNPEGALFLAENMNGTDYLHKNNKGESYIYLASQKGYVELIHFVADAFYETTFVGYDFSDLDRLTDSGDRALHVAKSSAVAEALRYEYYRGFLEAPYRTFQYHQNQNGQTFLHTAVRDQNSDLFRWGVEQSNCETEVKWEERFFMTPLVWGWNAIQSFGQLIYMDFDNLINTEDKEGYTVANLSAKNGFAEGIRILAECRWTDWLLEDNQGNIPLQNFLLSLDPLKNPHDASTKETFSFLMERQTIHPIRRKTRVDHINSTNHEEESSLHISARMADIFFYNSLKKYGDIEQKNSEGQSAKKLCELRDRKC